MHDDIEEALARDMLLIHSVAHKFAGVAAAKNLEYEDLVQTGVIGWLHAWHTFDPGRGKKFSDYAYPYIVHHIQDLLKCYNAIRMPRWLSNQRAPVTSYHNYIVDTEMVELEMVLGYRDDFTQVIVHDFLSSLTNLERYTVIGRMAGYKHQEIAQMLGSTQKSIEQRALAAKRKYLEYARVG